MELLLFAHRGEAQEFTRRYGFRPLDGSSDLYESADRLLLICGEGIYEVFSKLGPVLGRYPITKVVNLGIAGSLDPKVEVGDFISIRTVYCQSEQLQFHSYTLADEAASIDLITSSTRVLDDEHAGHLSNFAPTVDRELWAAAKLCSELNIPLYSYKLISDRAGTQTECFDLKQRALEFSNSLLEGYEKIEQQNHAQQELNYPMPMSFTQKAKYRKTLKALSHIKELEIGELISEIERKNNEAQISPKQKANLLLEEMEFILNPVKKRTKNAFEKLAIPLIEIGANALFDKSFEKRKFVLQMEINDQKNIDNLMRALTKINFSDFEKVWSGDSDV